MWRVKSWDNVLGAGGDGEKKKRFIATDPIFFFDNRCYNLDNEPARLTKNCHWLFLGKSTLDIPNDRPTTSSVR